MMRCVKDLEEGSPGVDSELLFEHCTDAAADDRVSVEHAQREEGRL